ncbi:MAG TPA: hypothetical protein VFZ57_03110 [Thermoanaerobaculia bacterium]|nr:hypothetical protein [Thermoanaerobaculia bacterium]
MKKLLGLTLGFAFSLAAAAPAFAAEVLYAADGAAGNPSNLSILNPATGAVVTTIGSIGFAVTGLAIHPVTGVMYGSTGRMSANSPHSLITINKTTGAGTLVGTYLVGSDETMADLTFTSDGTLYGWLEPFSDDLYTINTATGAATLVGNAGISTSGSGLAASSSDVLFFAGALDSGPLRTINRTTGLPTTVATMDGAANQLISALAFNAAGTLFGSRLDNVAQTANLITINTTTGHVTVIGPSVASLDAILFDGGTAPPSVVVPMLGERMLAILLLLLAAAGLWMSRRLVA